ncbi:dihydrolipoyl dehydrogenase [uncultured Rikenella sp.]|uniref:dihydrolipoyl dehydrogenase n=1 Tax=uncultured Rikenella sp. TaxID=368003 RepID=UPI00260CAB40|nr:dihydrolipoyl dehydrogenase [uncultured Rikenella sp.]
MSYDVMVIGSGPGGYAAAIRCAQLGLRTAVVERAELGGTCLNWGCIPTKALLKSAEVYRYASHAADYGVEIAEGAVRPDLARMVERSRGVAEQMSKGIDFLLKKNQVDVIIGTGSLTEVPHTVDVTAADGTVTRYEAKHIILATGARPREFPFIPVDGKRIITSRQALTLTELPETMVVIGSGAIGAEFATFFSTLGTRVTIVEYAPALAPLEDEEISKLLERSFRKAKITVMTGTEVKKAETTDKECLVTVAGKKGEQVLEADVVLSAVGIAANIEGIGLEAAGVRVERGKVVVDEHYRTSAEGIYAIGDMIPTAALAHVATAEAIHCAEFIAGRNPEAVDYAVIPSCIYTTPEVSSVGLTEAQAKEQGYRLRIGRFPYTASGKATAAGNRDGMVKLIFDADTDKLLGAHLFGLNVTEMVAEPSIGMTLGTTAEDIIRTIHPHPTMSEGIMEAAAASHEEAIHL